MIVFDEEPEVIPDPEPRFGSFLSTLNSLRQKLEANVDSDSQTVIDNLNFLIGSLQAFKTKAEVPTDAHIALRGAVHQETKNTIKLGNKDNFLTATLADGINGAPDKYVTPYVQKQVVQSYIAGFDESDYQLNTTLPFAALHNIDQFKRATKVSPSNVLQFKPGKAALIMNGDRIIVSPQYSATYTGSKSMFYSDSVVAGNSLSLREERMLADYYLVTGWNQKGGLTDNGLAGIFRPLANKGIYDYVINVPYQGTACFVLSSTFGDITHKGCLISCSLDTNNLFTLSHYFFGVNDPLNNPTLTQIVDSTYQAVYNTVGLNNVTSSAQKTRTFNLLDFFQLSGGVTIQSALAAGENPVITSEWRYLNREFLFSIAIPIILTIGTKTYNKVFVYSESVRPGKLVVADVASFTSLKTFSKDVIQQESDIANSKWLVDNSPTNLLNPVKSPGVINSNGLVVNAWSTRNSIKIKTTLSTLTNAVPLMTNPETVLDSSDSYTRTFVPSHYFTFGDLTERVLNISNDASQTTMLSYCLDNNTGNMVYKELNWTTPNVLTAFSDGTSDYGVVTANNLTIRDIPTLPASLVNATSSVGGISNSALAFTEANNFTGYASFAYSAGAVVLGSKVTVSPITMASLSNLGVSAMARAKALPKYATGVYPFKTFRNIFVVNSTKAIVVITDGVSYAEAGIFNYSITNGVLLLVVPASPVMTAVSTGNTANQGYRLSVSNDDSLTTHSDLLVFKNTNNTYQFALNRPFGELTGDISFTSNDIAATNVVFTPGVTIPAKTYKQTEFFDLLDEVNPPINIPLVGMFQNTIIGDSGSYLARLNGTDKVSLSRAPYSLFVSAPEGMMVILNGLVMYLPQTLTLGYANTMHYFYLEIVNNSIELTAYPTQQNPANNAVLLGVDLDGTGVAYTRSYIVVDNNVISDVRHGSTIPMVVDDGSVKGTTTFFQYQDVIRNR